MTEVIQEIQTTCLQQCQHRYGAKIISKMNYRVAQIKVSTWNLWSRVSMENVDDHSVIEGRAAHPQTRQRQNRGWHLCFQHSAPHSADFTAEHGSSSWLCRTRGKLILFTFNLLFPPLRNLERAKSCNTCIKNKCSRNGPTGSMQREAFVAWPRGPVAKSNRYTQYSSTYSRITITHI